jgi:hypothetical protein
MIGDDVGLAKELVFLKAGACARAGAALLALNAGSDLFPRKGQADGADEEFARACMGLTGGASGSPLSLVDVIEQPDGLERKDEVSVVRKEEDIVLRRRTTLTRAGCGLLVVEEAIFAFGRGGRMGTREASEFGTIFVEFGNIRA